jgi:DNA replication licensing factor MCM5
MDPYMVDREKSRFVDQQTLKLQEFPEDVPVGEMPRHFLLAVDRYLCNKVIPGASISVVGIYDAFQSANKNVLFVPVFYVDRLC